MAVPSLPTPSEVEAADKKSVIDTFLDYSSRGAEASQLAWDALTEDEAMRAERKKRRSPPQPKPGPTPPPKKDPTMPGPNPPTPGDSLNGRRQSASVLIQYFAAVWKALGPEVMERAIRAILIGTPFAELIARSATEIFEKLMDYLADPTHPLHLAACGVVSLILDWLVKNVSADRWPPELANWATGGKLLPINGGVGTLIAVDRAVVEFARAAGVGKAAAMRLLIAEMRIRTNGIVTLENLLALEELGDQL